MTIRLLFIIALACSLFAGERPSTNSPAAKGAKPQLPRGMPFHGKLGAFDKSAQTITLDGKEKKRIFYLTPATRVHRDNQPATINDLVVGQWVGGFVRPDAEGRPSIVTLNLGVTQRDTGSASTNAFKRGATK